VGANHQKAAGTASASTGDRQQVLTLAPGAVKLLCE